MIVYSSTFDSVDLNLLQINYPFVIYYKHDFENDNNPFDYSRIIQIKAYYMSISHQNKTWFLYDDSTFDHFLFVIDGDTET